MKTFTNLAILLTAALLGGCFSAPVVSQQNTRSESVAVQQTQAKVYSASVSRVSDGDSLQVIDQHGQKRKLRFAYIESTVAMIPEHPWGVGWYGYQFAFPDYDFYLNDPTVIMYHCHNLYLNVAAELGIIGLFLW